MKKLFLFGLITSSLLIKAQTNSDLEQQILTLQQQNSALQEKVNFCKLYNESKNFETKSFNSNFELVVLECIGNTTDQTVEITITIKHSLPHQRLYLQSSKAYGETGNSYDFKKSMFAGSNNAVFDVPTNLLLQGKLIFRNVLPQTENLKLVNGTISFSNKDGGGNNGKGEFEIRNLKIKWN